MHFQARNYDLKMDYVVWHYMADRFLEVTGFRKLLRNVDPVYDKQQMEGDCYTCRGLPKHRSKICVDLCPEGSEQMVFEPIVFRTH